MLSDFADSDDEYLAWLATLTRTHERRIRVRVMKRNHQTVAWLDDAMDGQVTIDTKNRDCTRVLSNLRLLDPSMSLGMEADSPASLPIHMRRMVQVIYEVKVPGYGWIGPPVFTGPALPISRSGAEATITAKGKEKLELGSLGRGYTWGKKRKKVDVIRDLLELGGEHPSRIHLPPLRGTLARPFNVDRTDKPLVKARQLARTMDDRLLFPDGRGHWRMRLPSKSPTRPFIDKDWLVGPVSRGAEELEFFNGWIVTGANPPGDKPRVSSPLIGLPANHPFSAQSLGEDSYQDAPYWVIRQEQRSQIKTKAKCTKVARRLRDDQVEAHNQISFDMLPLPNIEEWDLLRAIDPISGGQNVRVREATIPLVAGPMTVGSKERISRGGKRRGFHPAQHGGL